MQKPDSECANNHITHVSEIQMGFLGWIGNILEREKPVMQQLIDCFTIYAWQPYQYYWQSTRRGLDCEIV